MEKERKREIEGGREGERETDRQTDRQRQRGRGERVLENYSALIMGGRGGGGV